jgi:hypothetical protein
MLSPPARRVVWQDFLTMLVPLGMALVVFLLLTLFATCYNDFGLVVIGAGILLLTGISTVIASLTGSRRKAWDTCPECGKGACYYKADRGRSLTCGSCGTVWPAGRHPRI